MIVDIRSPEYRHNPYPTFRRLRAEAPVCRISPHGHWAIARYQDVLATLRNPKLFSSSGIGPAPLEGPDFLFQTRGLIGEDPPAHTRLRSLVNKAFTPLTVSRLEPEIRLLAEEMVRACQQRETFDFVRELAMPLPVVVISQLMGIDPDRRVDFKRWSDTLITWRNAVAIADPEARAARQEEILRDGAEMLAYFTEVIEHRRFRPETDLISALVHACDNEEKLTALEVLGFVRLLLVAGNETTTNLLGNAMLAMLSHPREWERVQSAPRLLPALVEETLRFDSPALSLLRRVTEDTELGGEKLNAGELVLPLLASANHDETKFPDPGAFDVTRDTQGHLSFGTGIHFCLGSPLARLQARIALEVLMRGFRKLERSEDGPLDLIDSFFFRGVRSLWLRAG